jgi:hypothetical protein
MSICVSTCFNVLLSTYFVFFNVFPPISRLDFCWFLLIYKSKSTHFFPCVWLFDEFQVVHLNVLYKSTCVSWCISTFAFQRILFISKHFRFRFRWKRLIYRSESTYFFPCQCIWLFDVFQHVHFNVFRISIDEFQSISSLSFRRISTNFNFQRISGPNSGWFPLIYIDLFQRDLKPWQ